MKIRFYTLLAFTIFSSAAFANPKSVQLSTAPFETIMQMANNATPLDFTSAQGMYTGRCFYKNNSEPNFASLALFSEENDADRGPLFPPESPRAVELLWSISPDNQTAAMILQRSLPFRNTFIQSFTPFIFATSFNTGRTLYTEVMQHENYILSFTRSFRHSSSFVTMACYYFNKAQ